MCHIIAEEKAINYNHKNFYLLLNYKIIGVVSYNAGVLFGLLALREINNINSRKMPHTLAVSQLPKPTVGNFLIKLSQDVKANSKTLI